MPHPDETHFNGQPNIFLIDRVFRGALTNQGTNICLDFRPVRILKSIAKRLTLDILLEYVHSYSIASNRLVNLTTCKTEPSDTTF